MNETEAVVVGLALGLLIGLTVALVVNAIWTRFVHSVNREWAQFAADQNEEWATFWSRMIADEAASTTSGSGHDSGTVSDRG